MTRTLKVARIECAGFDSVTGEVIKTIVEFDTLSKKTITKACAKKNIAPNFKSAVVVEISTSMSDEKWLTNCTVDKIITTTEQLTD